jgi:hypothetical protein
MSYFIQSNEDGMIMHANIQYDDMLIFFIFNFLMIWVSGILWTAILLKNEFGQA